MRREKLQLEPSANVIGKILLNQIDPILLNNKESKSLKWKLGK